MADNNDKRKHNEIGGDSSNADIEVNVKNELSLSCNTTASSSKRAKTKADDIEIDLAMTSPLSDKDGINKDTRKRKAELRKQVTDNCEPLSNAPVKMRKTTDDDTVVSRASHPPSRLSSSTTASESFLLAENDGLQNLHSTPPLSPSSTSRRLNPLSGTHVNHAQHHPNKEHSLSLMNDTETHGKNGLDNIDHHTRKVLSNIDTPSQTPTLSEKNELSRRQDEEGERKEEGGGTEDSVYATKWPSMRLSLLIVVISMLTILFCPSDAQLTPLFILTIFITLILPFTILFTQSTSRRMGSVSTNPTQMPTLREFLSHPDGFHISFAPAFFGFFAYFGCLAALEEETNGRIVPKAVTTSSEKTTANVTPSASSVAADATTTTTTPTTACCGLNSVSGASAGAMAAVMLAAGIQPRRATEFASKFTWKMIADPPGWLGYVRGDNFEEVMRKFIAEAGIRKTNGRHPSSTSDSVDHSNSTIDAIQLEDALVPISVSAFDLLRMKGINMTRGCMAKAARCSAGFPGLFQPVAWRAEINEEDKSAKNAIRRKSLLPDSLLIDGGIADNLGLNGLSTSDETSSSTDKKATRVVNMMVGDFGFLGSSGFKALPPGVNVECLVSIAIIGTPLCGPWAMRNGPRAEASARKAMAAVLDMPMERGTSDNHYIIRVDASKWLDRVDNQ